MIVNLTLHRIHVHVSHVNIDSSFKVKAKDWSFKVKNKRYNVKVRERGFKVKAKVKDWNLKVKPRTNISDAVTYNSRVSVSTMSYTELSEIYA